MPSKQYSIDDYFELLSRYPFLKEHSSVGFRLVLDLSAINSYLNGKNEKLGIIYEDDYVIVLRDLLENYLSKRFGYIRILNRRTLLGHCGVVVLPLIKTPGKTPRVLLIRIFRHALRSYALELPRGFGEPGLDGVTNAKKELLEEVGYEPDEIQLLGMIQPDSGLMNNPAEVYLAVIFNGREADATPESSEEIESSAVYTLPELEAHIAAGEITDAYTLSAITLAKVRGLIS